LYRLGLLLFSVQKNVVTWRLRKILSVREKLGICNPES
jgi:hypothetical protein